MARQKNMKFTGTVNGLIYYQLRGEYYVKTKPVNVNRTIASTRSAVIFGQATKLAASIRYALAPLLPNARDRAMMHRLNKAVNNWLQYAPETITNTFTPVNPLQGFNFNEACYLQSAFKTTLTVSTPQNNSIAVHIPAFNPVDVLTVPENCVGVYCHCLLIRSAINPPFTSTVSRNAFLIPYENSLQPAKEIIWTVDTTPGFLYSTAIALQYQIKKSTQAEIVKDIKWQPLGIIAALSR